MLANPGVIALRENCNGVVDFGHTAGIHDIVKSGMRVGGDKVFVNAPAEQHRFLGHDPEIVAKLVRAEMGDVLSVNSNAPLKRRVITKQELGQGAFPGS